MSLRKKILEFVDRILYQRTLIDEAVYTSKDDKVAIYYSKEENIVKISVGQVTMSIPLKSMDMNFADIEEEDDDLDLTDDEANDAINDILRSQFEAMKNLPGLSGHIFRIPVNSFTNDPLKEDLSILPIDQLKDMLKTSEIDEDYDRCIELREIIKKKQSQ